MGNMYRCHSCDREVRRGEAKIRSISFQQVAYCPDCWDRDHAPVVPAQRVSLEQRLAANS
jgi:DNA-directed RNA polymerase subunit RPC12/RpoP